MEISFLLQKRLARKFIEISDPSSPTIDNTFSTVGDANDVFVSGTNAYVADGAGGMALPQGGNIIIIEMVGIGT